MICGIVLAAGASSRMRRPKAALPLGTAGEPVLTLVVQTLLTGGVPRVVVVAGAHVDAVRDAMPRGETRATMIEHPQWAEGQLSSLLAGLRSVDDPQLEAIVVTLVDVPMVRAATVEALIDEWRRTRAPIVRPARGSQHGHPVIFDRVVFDDLRSADVNVGAKAVFAKHQAQVRNVAVDDPGAFEDIDTPEDYHRVKGAY